MADNPLKLPAMPTDASAASWPPRAPDKTPGALAGGYARSPGAPLFSPGGISMVPPAAAAVPAVAPTPAPAGAGGNPYAPGGVVPPAASPAAIAAFYNSAPLPATPVSSAAAPATKDPLANQIRFVDKDSPKVAARAAPNVIRGGVGGGGGITNRDVAALAPLIPAVKSPQERAGHALMDAYDGMHQADIDFAAATASGDPAAIANAQQRQAFFKSPAMVQHLLNLKTMNLPAFGTTEAQMQAVKG